MAAQVVATPLRCVNHEPNVSGETMTTLGSRPNTALLLVVVQKAPRRDGRDRRMSMSGDGVNLDATRTAT